MVKRIIGLTVSALEDFFNWSIYNPRVNSFVYEHKILMTPSLSSYYKTALKSDYLKVFQQWFAIQTKQTLFEIPSTEESAIESNSDLINELNSKLSSYLHPIIMRSESESITCGCKIKLLSFDQLEKGDPKGVLIPYCVNYSYTLVKNQSVKPFLDWLKEWFEDENNVDFVDPHICGSGKYELIEQLYLPLMSPKASITLYADEFVYDPMIASHFKSKYPRRVDMKKCVHRTMHDRYIRFDSFWIEISLGWDIIEDKYSTTIRHGTTATVKNNSSRPVLPLVMS